MFDSHSRSVLYGGLIALMLGANPMDKVQLVGALGQPVLELVATTV